MRRNRRHSCFRTGMVLLTLSFAAAARGAAQEDHPVEIDSLKASLIRQLLDVTGTAQLSLRALEASVRAQRTADTRIPQIFWDEFLERARNDVDRFVEWMMPVYDSHYSVTDLEDLIEFYQTPLGQRLLAAQPAVMQASIEAGQRWGAALGEEVGRDLAARGIIVP